MGDPRTAWPLAQPRPESAQPVKPHRTSSTPKKSVHLRDAKSGGTIRKPQPAMKAYSFPTLGRATLAMSLALLVTPLLQAAPSEADRLAMLEPPTTRVDAVLDTDTFNEIDDQFALAYAVRSTERLDLKAVFAAPFKNERSESPGDGMEKSYDEILRVLHLLAPPTDIPAFKGSARFLDDRDSPVDSPAARHLIELSQDYTSQHPLYVVATGAITNIASALLLDPDLTSRIVLVWVAGNGPVWPRATEFNSNQDLAASQVVFDSGVPLVQIPAFPVTTHLVTTQAELVEALGGKGKIAEYLLKIFEDYNAKRQSLGHSKVIWDIAGIAWLVDAEWIPSNLEPSPIIGDDRIYHSAPGRHTIRRAYFIKRDPIFKDLFQKLTEQN